MSTRIKWLKPFLPVLLGILSFNNYAVIPANEITLYTPFTKVTVRPGESIEYTIDVINNSSEIKNVEISLAGIPKGWTNDLKSGGYNINQLSILPGEKRLLVLNVEVPLNVKKGSYRFQVVAGGFDTLPLNLIVSEQGTFKTEFTSDQANMEGNANSSFTFQGILKNSTSENQLYALMANAPRGWKVIFNANYKQVTSVEVEANNIINVSIEIDPPDYVEAGSYKIPVRATTNATSANLDLEVVILGSFAIELTTPTGLLSSNITAGEEKRIELVINNTGSTELKDIDLIASTPIKWDVIFDPIKVDQLDPGKKIQISAIIKADNKAIPGDYVTHIEAKTPDVVSKASFRISVKTPMLWGWLGILIIAAALGSVYYMFRKYGRR